MEDQQKQEVMGSDILKSLTPAMQKFSEHYAVSGNIRRSSIMAGCYPDYGHQLLKREDVQLAVAYWQEVYAERSMFTPEKLVRQWALTASVDLTEYVNDDYTMKLMSELTEEQRQHLGAALVGLEVTEKAGKRYVKPRFAKVEALENLGKLMRLYGDEKGQGGEGLTLNINLGQQVNVGQFQEGSEEDLGPFKVRLPGMAPDGEG